MPLEFDYRGLFYAKNTKLKNPACNPTPTHIKTQIFLHPIPKFIILPAIFYFQDSKKGLSHPFLAQELIEKYILMKFFAHGCTLGAC